MLKKWILSILVSILFSILMFSKWIAVNNFYLPKKDELTTERQCFEFIDNHFSKLDTDYTTYSKIGINIETFEFESSNDIIISGHIWQKINKDLASEDKLGVIFPDAVSDTNFDLVYKKTKADTLHIGWWFQTELRQQFEYSDYPLDHKTVWIRMWPANFNDDIILIPDFLSYDSTGYEDIFGISDTIVLNGWDVADTYFDYIINSYDTDFGLGEDYTRKSHPELYYNVVLQRDFTKNFMTSLTLILIIMLLLFSLVLLLKSEQNNFKDKYGLNVSGAIGTASGLFFTVLLAHIDLKSKFNGEIVYLEYFYYLAYIFIIATAVLTYLFAREMDRENSWLIRTDATLIKLLYWPCYTGIMLIITWLVL